DPEGRNKIQNWGNVGGAWHAHENHNGKHIKDCVSTQRSHILGDSTKITINGRLTAQQSQVSIYDNDQTHRFVINHPTDSYEMVWSCALPMFEDELEYDGETSRVSYDDEGMWWHNIYMEAAGPGGTPGPRSHGNEPLSRTYFLNPNNVTDYYDDPRLGHTCKNGRGEKGKGERGPSWAASPLLPSPLSLFPSPFSLFPFPVISATAALRASWASCRTSG